MSTKKFAWKGFNWIADTRRGAPGPNNFSTANVFVQPDTGYLHLRINKIIGAWNCATMKTATKLGYGTYKCVIKGPLNLDKNMVFGFFNYGGIDYINEIDVEISRWGDKTYPPLAYTVYPAVPGPNAESFSGDMDLGALESIHSFEWTPKGVSFMSKMGSQTFVWDTTLSPNIPMPLYFDLWLMLGRAPSNKLGTEIVIKDFSFVPMPGLQE